MTGQRKRPSGAKPPDTPWDWTRRASHIARILERILDGEARDMRGNQWRVIAAAHGYPSCDAMRDNLEQLRRFGDEWVCFNIPPKPKQAGDHGCECGARFTTYQKLAVHRARATKHQEAS